MDGVLGLSKNFEIARKLLQAEHRNSILRNGIFHVR